MQCSHEYNGCDWKGTVGTLENHVAECGYALVSCPNDCKENGKTPLEDQFQLLKKDLEDHLSSVCPERKYSCAYCRMVDTYKFITESHDEKCEKKIVDCTNQGCSMRMERGQVESHVRESCDYTEVYCKYASIGCQERRLRMKIKPHEEDSDIHLKMALDKIVELNMIALKVPIKDSSKKVFRSFVSCKQNSVTFKLKGYSDKMKSCSRHCFQPFLTSPSGYKICLLVYPITKVGGSYMSVFLKVLHGPYDSVLEWPIKVNFTVELLNQLADSNHLEQTIKFKGDDHHCKPGGSGYGRSEFVSLSRLPLDSQRNTQYLENDVLYFRVTPNISSHKPWLDHTHE